MASVLCMIRLVLTLSALLMCLSANAARLNYESYYQDIAAAKYKGEKEVIMPDGTRCDIVTATHAIELDFADKWAESIGQALYYGFQTNKRAGILLILEDPKDKRHLLKVQSVIEHYELPIDVLPLKAWEIEDKGQG